MKRQTDIECLLELNEWIKTDEHVGLRVRADIPQSVIGKASGVTKGCVTRWERHQRRPRGQAALAYHRALRRLAEAEARSRSEAA